MLLPLLLLLLLSFFYLSCCSSYLWWWWWRQRWRWRGDKRWCGRTMGLGIELLKCFAIPLPAAQHHQQLQVWVTLENENVNKATVTVLLLEIDQRRQFGRLYSVLHIFWVQFAWDWQGQWQQKRIPGGSHNEISFVLPPNHLFSPLFLVGNFLQIPRKENIFLRQINSEWLKNSFN